MNIGLYQGAASLAACERWQQIVAQNIASASVPGFRKTEASFAGVMGDVTRLGEDGGFAKEVPGAMPQPMARISTLPGELRTTNNEFDFAVQGRGFFQVQKADGTLGYTRDGEFHVSADRTLVTKQGFPVMGDGGAITLKPGGGRISINADGTLLQGETPAGKLAVYDFPDPRELRRVGDGLLAPTDGTVPEAVERPSVLTGALEGSNVQPLQEMVNLVTIARAYEAAQRVILANDEALDKAVQILGNPGS